MDSEHRHELKENDLYAFFRNFKTWWAKHGTQTLLVILLCVLALTAYRHFRGKDFRELDAAWSEYASVSTVEGRQQIAGVYVNRPGLSNLALLDAADELAMRVFSFDEAGMPTSATTTELTQEQRETLEQAAALYQRVIDAPQPTQPSLHLLNARMGLASVHETLGEWDQAEVQYRNVIKDAGSYRNIALVAERLLSSMDERQEPIAFQPAPDVEGVDDMTGAVEMGPTTGGGNTLVLPNQPVESTPESDEPTAPVAPAPGDDEAP